MSVCSPALPRLLYLGDAPVEASYHGSMLLYRLLQNYPCENLVIIESSHRVSLAERRLPGVRYAAMRVGNARLLHTRFGTWYSSWLTLTAPGRARRIGRLLPSFRPDAVLTVAHGYPWITAAAFAKKHGLRLHLILHDDWPRVANVIDAVKARLDATFSRIYRQASSRFCVSPFMRDFYRERYRADGEVLYPSRAADCPVFARPAERLFNEAGGLIVAFAGTINSGGYARLLRALAECLRQRNGTLLLFGPFKRESLAGWGLNQPNVRCEGLIASHDLIQRVRRDVDVLFVPMSFGGVGEQENMRSGFPSKLTDYTATGLPLLICGPNYCSAVRWAQEHQPVAEVVTSERSDALAQALDRLASVEHRIMLAARALEVGEKLFSHVNAERIFFAALQSDRKKLAVACE